MEAMGNDVRYALRMLRKNPGFTAVAILTLALGIGANTAIFSVVRTVLLDPLPYPEPERMVLVRDVQPRLSSAPASYHEFLDWKQQGHVFEALSASAGAALTMTGQGDPEQVFALRVTPSLFPLLGIQPLAGRTLVDSDDEQSAGRVCMITYGFWQRRFAGDRSLVGKTLMLNGLPHTVVGILPATLRYGTATQQIYIPMRLTAESAPRGLHFLYVLGRLRPGISVERARQEIGAVAERLKTERSTTHSITLFDLREQIVGDSRAVLLVLMGAVGFILLIACANVANLVLGRTAARQREIAVRAALGASRGRLVRQVLTENLVLALAGGMLGVLLAVWVVSGLRGASGLDLPRIEDVRVDPFILAFSMGLSLVAGLMFGLVPLGQWLRGGLVNPLKEGGGHGASSGSGQKRLRGMLVVSEVALSLVLLLGAGLLLNSLFRLMQVPKGFQTENVLTFSINLPPARYGEPPRQAAFYRDLLERLRATPGVVAAGGISELPLTGSTNGGFAIEGVTFPPDQRPLVEKRIVSPGYFHSLGIPLVRGRDFSERDALGTPGVMIINEAFARTYFPNEDPIGKRVAFEWGIEGFQEVIGVVGDVRDISLEDAANPASYVSMLQRPNGGMYIAIRSSQETPGLPAAVRSHVAAMDADLPVSNLRRMEEVADTSVASRRAQARLLGSFAALALVLAGVGIYGVMSILVTQRIHEIGIRMALGAQRGDILRMVVGQGMAMTAAGLAIGAVGSIALTRFLSSLLFGVSATDPLTFTVVVILLAAVAIAACLVPAFRAMRVDPIQALRYE